MHMRQILTIDVKVITAKTETRGASDFSDSYSIHNRTCMYYVFVANTDTWLPTY